MNLDFFIEFQDDNELIYQAAAQDDKRVVRKSVKNVNALFILQVHLAIKLVHRHFTFNNLKETIQT